MEWKRVENHINCFDHGKSKDLFAIAKELGLLPDNATSSSIRLDNLRALVATHKAFETLTKLQKLAEEFGVKIIYCPKYHCELNFIEGLWCASKHFVRKYNDQSFENLNNLINLSMKNIKNLIWILNSGYVFGWLWKCIIKIKTYKDVLQSLFGAKRSEKVVSRQKYTHMNTNLA